MHLASPASPADFERIPIQILKVGGLGTHNGLGLAKAKGAKFFLASTSEVYGDPLVHPQPETYWGNVNPIGPRGVYDEAKRYAEAMTMAYHRHHGVDVRIVRIFNSVLADEQVLYDDGDELRRETIGELAAPGRRQRRPQRLLACRRSTATGRVGAADAIALVGHPPTGPCFEVTHEVRPLDPRDRRSQPVRRGPRRTAGRRARSVSSRVGDRVAIAPGSTFRPATGRASRCSTSGRAPAAIRGDCRSRGRASAEQRLGAPPRAARLSSSRRSPARIADRRSGRG